ncbi:hypothetical protein BH23CHL7_BH23CHL7_08980 [soil metagenome]
MDPARPIASLDELFAALAGDLADVTIEKVGEAKEYRRADHAFAALAERSAEFALDPEVAEAAARTPDAGPSQRGGGWVHLEARQLGPHTLDRARAWFLSAWRAAGKRR